ncbi:MAG: DUF554 domain-containing protein [Anaerolineales bacterium]
MTGTILNIITVLIGGALGLLFGARLSENLKKTVVAGMGLFTFGLGVQMFLATDNSLIVLGALLIGILLGEWWRIEDRLQGFGEKLEKRFAGSGESEAETGADGKSRFVRGFLTSSLLFCVGPLTILGSIQDGLDGNFSALAVKSVLDGFAAMAFASSLGGGVLFSTIVILVFQGGISLTAMQVQSMLTLQLSPELVEKITLPYINELTATGGVILMGLALSSLLEIKKIRTGNFLPALAVAPLIVWILNLLRL